MHEMSLLRDIIAKIQEVARTQKADRVTSVHFQVGELCHLSVDHLKEHFDQVAAGTVAEGAEITMDTLPRDHPHGQEVILKSVEVE